MRNLLILCAGNQMADDLPLFLQRHPDGKRIAQKVIEDIFPGSYDRIVYVILDETEQKYQSSHMIRETVGKQYPVEIVCLPCRTSGPAETAYQAILAANLEGEIAIRDSHCQIRLGERAEGNCVAGLDLSTYEGTIENLRLKSFIVVNEQDQILDVVEKRLCSDMISTGLYSFKNADDFIMSFEKLCDRNYPIDKVYVSHIVSYLIGYSQRVFRVLRTESFEDWSTEEAWEKVQERYATYFLDLDTSGYFDNTQVWNSYCDRLRKISRDGACLIFFTARKDLDGSVIIKCFHDLGISVHTVVQGCSYSNRRGILDTGNLKKINGGEYR